MANQITELKNTFAASVFILPATLEQISKREWAKNYSKSGLERILLLLEKSNAVYYRGEKVHVYKAWAKKNLQEYNVELD